MDRADEDLNNTMDSHINDSTILRPVTSRANSTRQSNSDAFTDDGYPDFRLSLPNAVIIIDEDINNNNTFDDSSIRY